MRLRIKNGGELTEVYDYVIRFFLAQLLSPYEISRLNLRIIFDGSILDNADSGYTEAPYYRGRPPRKFTVYVRRSLDADSRIGVLAHEMVHVAQFTSCRLKYVVNKWDTDVYFNGYYLGFLECLAYNEHPWEEEAYSREIELIDLLEKELKDD